MLWADAMATPANSAAVLSNSCLLIQRSFRVFREFPSAAEFSRFLGLLKKTNPREQGSRFARAGARFLRMFHVHWRFRFLAALRVLRRRASHRSTHPSSHSHQSTQRRREIAPALTFVDCVELQLDADPSIER